LPVIEDVTEEEEEKAVEDVMDALQAETEIDIVEVESDEASASEEANED
jgi:hypothetical protein